MSGLYAWPCIAMHGQKRMATDEPGTGALLHRPCMPSPLLLNPRAWRETCVRQMRRMGFLEL